MQRTFPSPSLIMNTSPPSHLVLPVACAKVWALGIKAKFSMTEKMLPVFGKQVSVKYFFYILADAENSSSTSPVLTSLYFFLRRSWLWFALKGNSKRECRKWRETVTVPDLENGCLGSEAWGLWQSAAASKHFTERAGRVPMLSCGFQKAIGARNNSLHHYLIST